MIQLQYEIDRKSWENYQKKLAQYIVASKRDVGTILTKKTDSIRLKILKALTRYAPSKAKIHNDAAARDYRTRLTSEKALQTASIIFAHKEDYRHLFEKEGITFDENTKKLTPKMMSRTLATIQELKGRARASRYHASTWRTPKIPTQPTTGNITVTSRDRENVLDISIKTNVDNPSVIISNRAPAIAELIYGKQILEGVLAQEEADMDIYIKRKLEENKNKI